MKIKKSSSARASGSRATSRSMPLESKDKEPSLMIQVSDPKNLRKELLEALREVIIFMQGYETFRKIQEEKVALFAQLKEDVKVLNNLVDTRLRKFMPKGKLTSVVKRPIVKVEEAPVKEEREQMPTPRPQPKAVMPKLEPQQEEDNELDELESQLREIESRLKHM